MAYLVIVRHGQSVWNLENRFTGEVDVDLSPHGEEEARQAGQWLRPYPVDCAFTSVLKRAVRTLEIIEQQTGQTSLPVTKSAALNERNYGDLQGLNKDDVARQFGVKQLDEWRRSYAAVPPHGESLEHTHARVVPYYRAEIKPKLRAGQNVLIVAHGNSLRSLMMYLEHISETNIASTELATGVPRLYRFNNNLKLEKAMYLSVSEKTGVIGS